MKPKSEFVIALALVLLAPGAMQAQGLPPNPLTVTPTLDTAHATTQSISAATGGTVTATGADGSVFTLAIPPNALLSDEFITMTPLSAVAGLPASGGLLAGVHLSPDGLNLRQAATLTIVPAAQVPIDQQVGFGYHTGGQEFYFQSLGLSNAITISLLHFSGAGAGQGTPGDGGTPTSPADQLQHQAAQLINQERACQLVGGSCSDLANQLAALLQDEYTQVVQPLAQQALTDDSVADAALQAMLGWARNVQLLGFDQQAPFSAEVQTILAQVPQILTNVYNKAFGRCLNQTSQGQRMIEAQKMISAERLLELLGNPPNPGFSDQLAACIAGPINFSFNSSVSETVPVGPLVERAASTVSTQQIPLTFDSASLTYSGSGPLNYDQHSFNVDWGVPTLADCSSGVGNPGTVDVRAAFDLNVSPFAISSASQLRLNLTINPNVTETETLCSIDLVTGQRFSAVISAGFYVGGFGLANAGSSAVPTPISPFFVNLNSPQTFNFSGSSPAGNTAQEMSTITLAQTSP